MKKDKEDAADVKDDKDAKDDLEPEKKGKWVVAARLAGKVTKVTPANTDSGTKITIQVTTQVLQGPGAPKVNNNQTLDPEKGQATFIVIGKRAPQVAPKGDNGIPLAAAGRYLLPAMPLFLLLGRWVRRWPTLDTLLIGGGFALQAIFTAYFLTGGYVI